MIVENIWIEQGFFKLGISKDSSLSVNGGTTISGKRPLDYIYLIFHDNIFFFFHINSIID